MRQSNLTRLINVSIFYIINYINIQKKFYICLSIAQSNARIDDETSKTRKSSTSSSILSVFLAIALIAVICFAAFSGFVY
jgi:hypothetical protein